MENELFETKTFALFGHQTHLSFHVLCHTIPLCGHRLLYTLLIAMSVCVCACVCVCWVGGGVDGCVWVGSCVGLVNVYIWKKHNNVGCCCLLMACIEQFTLKYLRPEGYGIEFEHKLPNVSDNQIIFLEFEDTKISFNCK